MSGWSPARRLVAFAIGLLVVFGAGLGMGSLGDDVGSEADVDHREPHATTSTTTGGIWQHDHGSHTDGSTDEP